MTTKLIRPVIEPAEVTSPYGDRVDPVTGEPGAHHPGIDYISHSGDAGVLAIAAGKIIWVHDTLYQEARRWELGTPHSLGRALYLQTEIHGQTVYVLHAHLDRVDVRLGDTVQQGDRLGVYGTTGYSTGPHLHIGFFDENWQELPADKIMIPGLQASGKTII